MESDSILETKQKGLFEQQSNFQPAEKKYIWENQSNGHVVNQLPNVRYRDCFFKGLVGSRKKNPLYSIDRREDFYENVVVVYIYCTPYLHTHLW